MVDTRPAEFEHGVSHVVEWREFEFACAVVAQMACAQAPVLQAIGADNRTGPHIFNQQVVADSVELVDIQATGKRL